MSERDEERERLRKQMELSQSLERLKHNPDFNRVILKGFMEQEVINVNRQASREVSAEAKLTKSQQAQAGPVLESYLLRIENEGMAARDNMLALDHLNDDD